ncbi:Cu(I)-responsive transcriptional regulator [uncultured Roseobacter sp.]|uniref:Cu(I)-responsive transcriptional regulator n=1 Tax=uncultured Roseobacter sp. TaxID=114847 RepID=UPI002608EB45|nr:Cu(I)-responsive transcriptional regulator [uncultured Roseobacter sp.]
MNISDVAKRTGLPVKTIRYYEDIGLIAPARSGNGYRSFSDSDIHKLAFLGRARSLGFGIDACRGLLRLYNDKSRASADVKKLAQEHLAEIDQKLSELHQMRDTLSHLIETCAGNDRPDCPILADLASEC